MRFPKALPPYSGACLCGDVKYVLTAWPVTYYACHCIDCQRRTGGAMRLAMWVEKAALKVVHGQPKLRVFEFGEARQRRAMFCVDCDTRLWAEPTNRPQLASLFPGTLYNHAEFEPVAHIWTRSALPWVSFPPGASLYDTQPSDWNELKVLWQQATSTRQSPDAA